MMPLSFDVGQGMQPVLFQNASAAMSWCQEFVCTGPTLDKVQLALWITIGILFANLLLLWYRYRHLKKLLPPEQRPPSLFDIIKNTNIDEEEPK